jgi:hypothetical protein
LIPFQRRRKKFWNVFSISILLKLNSFISTYFLLKFQRNRPKKSKRKKFNRHFLIGEMFKKSFFSHNKLNVSNLNQNVLKAKYAVRGAIVIKALEYEEDLKKGKKLPFNKLLFCNIGNPLQLVKKHLTFHRNVNFSTFHFLGFVSCRVSKFIRK